MIDFGPGPANTGTLSKRTDNKPWTPISHIKRVRFQTHRSLSLHFAGGGPPSELRFCLTPGSDDDLEIGSAGAVTDTLVALFGGPCFKGPVWPGTCLTVSDSPHEATEAARTLSKISTLWRVFPSRYDAILAASACCQRSATSAFCFCSAAALAASSLHLFSAAALASSSLLFCSASCRLRSSSSFLLRSSSSFFLRSSSSFLQRRSAFFAFSSSAFCLATSLAANNSAICLSTASAAFRSSSSLQPSSSKSVSDEGDLVFAGSCDKPACDMLVDDKR